MDKIQYLDQFSSITQKNRTDKNTNPSEINGPVLDLKCDHICPNCLTCVNETRLPKNSLANGLWIGEVPKELQVLTWAERQLVARVKASAYLVQVNSGR